LAARAANSPPPLIRHGPDHRPDRQQRPDHRLYIGGLFELPENFKWIGIGSIGAIPVAIVIFVIVVLVFDFLLRRITAFRLVCYTGSNEKAAAYSGIRTKRVITGCRLNEVMSLKWSHVDFDGPALHLPDSKTGAKVVHVGQPVVDLLQIASRAEGNAWVISGTLPGKPLSDLQPFWQRVRARAGVKDVRIHDLRHTFASAAVASGQGLPMIGKLLGHTQVQTTARYAHLAAEPVKKAADAVAQNLQKALG
jgi:integrase